MANGFYYNTTTSTIETTGSLNVQAFGVTGSLLGTSSWAVSASWAALPRDGVTNQVLTKKTFTDQDVEWAAVAVPASGSTQGLIQTYYDADQGKVVYYDAPLVYFGNGFSGSYGTVVGATSGTPYRTEYTGNDTFVVLGDMLTWANITINDVVVLDAQGNIVKTGSYANPANPPGQSPGQTKIDSPYTTFYAAAQQVNTLFPVTVAGASINRWDTTTWAQDTTFATNVVANAVNNALVLDVNNAGEIAAGSSTGTIANYRHVYKLNANGTLNTTFQSKFASAQPFGATEIRDICVLSDGKVILVVNTSNDTIVYDTITICTAFTGGIFILMNSNGNYIAHGQTDPGSRRIAAVKRDAIDGTKFIIGGEFTTMNYYNGATLVATINQGVQRIKNDGTYDTTWNTSNAGGTLLERTKIRWFEPYYYYVPAGATYNGTSVARLFRTDKNGYLDTSFSVDAYAGVSIRDAAVMSNGSIVGVGSSIDTMYPKIAKWSQQGDLNIAASIPTTTNKALTAFSNGVQVTGSLSITGSIQFTGEPSATNIVYASVPVTTTGFDPVTTSPWNTTAVPVGAMFVNSSTGVLFVKVGQPANWTLL